VKNVAPRGTHCFKGVLVLSRLTRGSISPTYLRGAFTTVAISPFQGQISKIWLAFL